MVREEQKKKKKRDGNVASGLRMLRKGWERAAGGNGAGEGQPRATELPGAGASPGQTQGKQPACGKGRGKGGAEGMSPSWGTALGQQHRWVTGRLRDGAEPSVRDGFGDIIAIKRTLTSSTGVLVHVDQKGWPRKCRASDISSVKRCMNEIR